MVLGAVAPRGIAENELKLSLSRGEENGRESRRDKSRSGGWGAQAPREFAENELKLSLSMGEENVRNSIGK